MARLDIYPNPIVPDRSEYPYVLEIQSDLLYRFMERVCVPLARPGTIAGLTERFNPTLIVDGAPVRMHPLGISVFFLRELNRPVGSAKQSALEVDDAMDMLLRGY